MRAGAQEVLRRPLDRGALSEAVERVSQMAVRKQGGATQRSVTTVFSNKGGVGVTTIATNLALSFRRRSQRSVALIDFDYQSGDVASMLGVVPVRSMGDLLGADRVESATVQGAMMKHPSGVMVLPQPEHIDQSDGLTAHYSGRILETVSSMHDVVVVDAPHMFNDVALEIFDRSSQILLVCEMSIPSVRAARRSLELFHRLNYLAVPDRIRLVANRRDERSAITPLQVEETLGMPVAFHVANDYAAVSESINLGRPLCSEHPSSKAGRDIEAIARGLMPNDAAEEDVVDVAPRKRLNLFGRG